MQQKTNLGNSERMLLAAIAISTVLYIVYFAADYLSRSFTELSLYVPYLYYLFVAIAIISIGYSLVKMLTLFIDRTLYRHTGSEYAIVKFALQAILYILIIVFVLSAIGVSPSDIIVEGAIGGVVIGLALQTITPIILSGILISSSRAVSVGDIMALESWVWGANTPIFCKIKKIGAIYTEVYLPNGTIKRIPNSVILGNTISTKLSSRGNLHRYTTRVPIKNDVKIELLESIIKKNIEKNYKSANLPMPDFNLSQLGESTYIYDATFYFADVYDISKEMSALLKMFDISYDEAKKAKTS
jgi:small-conductance mechanosensitive channel